MSDAPEPPPGPAESRAIELLGLLARDTPTVSERFASEVVVRARRQRAIAVPLRALGGLVAALTVAVFGAMRPGHREPPR